MVVEFFCQMGLVPRLLHTVTGGGTIIMHQNYCSITRAICFPFPRLDTYLPIRYARTRMFTSNLGRYKVPSGCLRYSDCTMATRAMIQCSSTKLS